MKFKFSKNLLILLGVILVLGLSGFAVVKYWPKKEAKVTYRTVEKTEEPKKIEKPRVIPPSYDLVVPYTVQAPFANWKVHEESCEEAALLMYEEYLKGSKTDIPPATADKIFREMKTWQVKNYGKEPDLTLDALGKLGKSYYGRNYVLINNLDENKIKQSISEGKPVIVPVMTHSLKNNHYGRENTYHILLIKGYDQTGIIANDAGIRQGKNWHYSWAILWQAIAAQKVSPNRQGLVILK